MSCAICEVLCVADGTGILLGFHISDRKFDVVQHRAMVRSALHKMDLPIDACNEKGA